MIQRKDGLKAKEKNKQNSLGGIYNKKESQQLEDDFHDRLVLIQTVGTASRKLKKENLKEYERVACCNFHPSF